MRKYSTPIIKTFTVGDQKVDLEAVLNCPFEDIREAAEKIPALIGWFGHQKAVAREREVNADFARKQTEARVYFDLKGGQFVAKGFGEKMTETALEKAVLLIPEVQAATEKYARAKKDVEWINGCIDALEAKLELVRSSEVTRRMEHETDRNRSTE